MFFNKPYGKRPLALAVAAAITPALASSALAQTSRGASAILEEVVVTATKRAENLQDVPISVQALTGDSMRAQGALTFDDYVNFMPNVTEAGNGPGNKEVYIRGSATEQSSVTVALAQGQRLAWRCTSMKRLFLWDLATLTSTRRTLSVLRRSRALRARCLVPVRRPAPFA